MPFSRWGKGETTNGIVADGSCPWELSAAKLKTAATYVEAAAEGFRTRVRLPPPPPKIFIDYN